MRNTLPCILMNGLISKKVLKIGKKDQHKDTNKNPLAQSAKGEKRRNVLLFQSKPKIMDIFFFLYYIFYGLPLGVVEVPQGVDADENRNLQELREIVTGSECP